MITESPVTLWLALGAAAVVALQLLLVGAMFLRGLWASWRLRRLRGRSRIVRELLDALEHEPSPHVRRELAGAGLRRDLHALEAWIDEVSRRGNDPADLPPHVYEDAGLVDRYLETLRTDRRWTRRAAAAAILGWTGSPHAVPALLACVQDTRGEARAVRTVALRALGRIRHPDAVAPLLEALASPETWLPRAAAAMLARIGRPALPRLTAALADEDAPTLVRRWAAQILGDIGDRRALPVLLRSLGDIDGEIRARTSRSLGAIGDERAVDPLLERLLVDPVPFVRTSVARALGAVGNERALQMLVEALADPEWWVRLRAVEALEHLGTGARDILVASISDPDPQVGREAARALEGIGVIAEALDSLRSDGYTPAVGEMLIDVGRAGNIEPLLDELESEDEDHLRTVVRILARVGDHRAGESLAQLLERTTAASLRARIVDALRRVGDDTHVDRVLPLLQDEDEWLRKAVTDYLAEFGGPETIDAVVPLVDDENPWTRESALRVLERLRPEGLDPAVLLARVDDDQEFVRAQAVRTLCAVGAFPSLVDDGVLIRIAEPALRDALLDGLRDAADPEALPLVRQLAAFCADRDLDRLRLAARAALVGFGPGDVDALLRAGLRDEAEPSERWLAAVAWPRAGAEMTDRCRDRLFEDRDPRVRAALLHAFTERPPANDDLAALLERALEDEAPHVLRAALHTAVRELPRVTRAAVASALDHEDEDVRIAALLAHALTGEVGGRAQVTGIARADDPGVRLARVLGQLARGRGDAIRPWLALLADREVMETLARWEASARPLVLHALESARDHPGLAQRLLACRIPFEAERILVDELENSPDAATRLLALEGIADIGSERGSGRVLTSFLKDRAPEVRARALRELVGHDVFGRRRQFLEQAFQDPDERLQIAAAHLCAGLDPQEAVELLGHQLVASRPSVREAVTDILAGVIEDDPENSLDTVLGMPPTPERYVGLVIALEKAPVPISTELLELLFTHRWARVRAEALRALLPRRSADAWSLLERAVGDPSPSVRERAIQALVDPRLPALREDRVRCKELLDRSLTDPSPRVRSRIGLVLAGLPVDGRVRMLRELARDPQERVARVARRAEQRRRKRREEHADENATREVSPA